MKINTPYMVKIYALVGILMLTMGVGSSYAGSGLAYGLDTASGGQVSASQLAAVAARAKKNTKNLIEENDKPITNVKVFYNPVAEQISVSFKLSKTVHVSIKVMDALGNEVMGLLNEDLEEGNQNLSFETNNKLPVGFYFVRVTASGESVIKRVSIR